MKKIKLVIYVLFIFFISLLFTGCTSYQELNNIMIVDSIGINKVNDTYEITFNTYLENNNYELYTIKENDLEDSFNDIYLQANKKIYLSHLNLLILSSSLTNNDIINIINIFNNQNDLRGNFRLIMVDNYSTVIFDNDSTSIISMLDNNKKESGIISSPTFNDVINNYYDISISYLPLLNNDLEIIGMHSIFSEYLEYDIDKSLFLNIILDNTTSFSFNINSDTINVTNSDISYFVYNNTITINISLNYNSNIDKYTISNYLETNINDLLDSNINLNYFDNLIKIYNYDYYQTHSLINIKFNLNINLIKEDITNLKDGDLIEENI